MSRRRRTILSGAACRTAAVWVALAATLCASVGAPGPSAAEETAPPAGTVREGMWRWPSRLRVLGKAHTIAVTQDLSGPGSNVPGLASNFDMTLFEAAWGGRQAAFNGAGITTNTSYPLTEGEALVTTDDAGLAADLGEGREAGFRWQTYALAGNQTVGRTYGTELPWGNFNRVGTVLIPEHFATSFNSAWIKDTQGPVTYQATVGTLKDQPELANRETNFIRLGSLLYRAPVTGDSFWSKEDRKLEPGRHSIRGGDVVIDLPYAGEEHLHGELFLGRTTPTPVQEIDRDVFGTRWGLDVLEGNVGLSYVRSVGDRPPAIPHERQTAWALDGSYHLLPWLDGYGVWARTEYHRRGQFYGNAWVGGARLTGPWKSEWRTQYQWIGENYDLMGYHKVEHYPSNFQGVQTSVGAAIKDGSAKLTVYRLYQLDTNTRPNDTVFGDSYFPALNASKRGHITAYRAETEYDLGKAHPGLPKLATYLEQVFFRKSAPNAVNNDIDKTVSNWSVVLSQPLLGGLTLDMGYRLVRASGRWQAMRFHHRQGMPEVALQYRIKDKTGKADRLRITALYQRYDFVDSIAASAGHNNYEAHQLVTEVQWIF